MRLDARALGRVSDLFEALVDLPDSERARALQELDTHEPAIAAELRRWLTEDARDQGVLDVTSHRFAVPFSESDSTTAPDRSGQIIAGFELLRRVGRGGMGEVYEAQKTGADFEQRVAIKLLRLGLDTDDMRRRFLRERRILAQLQHPGIARLLDGGVSADGLSWLAMEFVDGAHLLAAAQAQKPSVTDLLGWFLQVCDAVAYAHHRLIVHRDLKPSNVLLTADRHVKLLDFGIAKLLDDVDDDALTGTGIQVLTPAYAAPEQILGQPISTATDVYALGLILYELLTGERANQHQSRSLDELVRQLDQHKLPAPSVRLLASNAGDAAERQARVRLARQISGELDTIVLHALKREPDRRYQSAAELADDLRRHLNGHPVRAHLDSPAYRLRKFIGRHRVGVFSAAIAASAIVGGLSVALWQTKVARAEAARAESALQRAESIKAFSLSLFREQDPLARSKPEPRSAEELIDIGIARAREQFVGQPEERATLLKDLGEIEVSLASFDKALDALNEARSLRAAEPDAARTNRASVAEVDIAIATARMGLGEYAEALALFERSLPTLRQHYGAESPQMLAARAHYSKALFALGRRDEAIAEAAALLPIHERVLGHDAPETIARLADIASLQEQSDQPDAAEQSARRLIARIEQVYGPEHALLIRPLSLLADVLRRRQQYALAEPVYQRGIALARQHDSRRLLAGLLLRQGDLMRRMQRLDEAEPKLAEAASLLPEGTPERANVVFLHAAVLRARGDLDAASKAFQQAFEQFRAALGPDSVYAWNASLQQVLTERQAGRGAAAEAQLLETVAKLRQISSPESFEVASAASALADWRALQGRHRDALPLFDEALAVSEKLYGADHPDSRELRLARAESLLALADTESRKRARLDAEFVVNSDKPAAPLSDKHREHATNLLQRLATNTR
ncbi:protein kinase domain-containing protein [Ahniella affigens]|nr:tetratricopeptide repeat protein [Ahniella affigens]